MTLSLPFEVLFVLYILQKENFEAYLVGGAVRDLIINSIDSGKTRQIIDFDFASNATPEQIQTLFLDSYYENDFGTVGIAYENLLAQLRASGIKTPIENMLSNFKLASKRSKDKIIDLAKASKLHESLQDEEEQKKQVDESSLLKQLAPFEITTYRSEGLYQDFRKPSKLSWGKSIKEDLERRDFTINALALAVNQNYLQKIFEKQEIKKSQFKLEAENYQLLDQHQAMKDLLALVIRTVGDANMRFQEDALRMLRAIRFAVQLNMEIDTKTYKSIKTNADLIKHISWERIRDEFLKMLSSDYPKKAIKLLDETGLLQYILPELSDTKGVDQGGHHTTDVWNHSLDSLQYCPSHDPIVRLATLLHDIAKAQTYQVRAGQITFYNHEILGSRIVSKIAKRFNLSNREKQRLFILVRYHMFYYQAHNTDASIRRFMKKVGLENIDDILDLREGDRLGSGARKTSWRLEEFKQRMIEQLQQPMDIKDLAINGHDLMTHFKLKQGPILGKILNALFELVLDDPEKNERDFLLAEAEKILKGS
ncbi:MAG: HDIG domain-containing protein [Candidatus Woesebacteria bacterium]|jgi:putative nucleotidyltransferase with HDIG domain